MNGRWWRILRTQVCCEMLKLVRMRIYLVLLLGVPIMLYNATAINPRVPDLEGIPARVYMIATLGTFAVFGSALFGVALERGHGWTRTLSTAPISPWIPIMAKLLVCMMMSAASLVLLLITGALFYGVRLPVETILLLLLTMVSCSVPLGSIGLALGAWIGPNSAPIVMILIYMMISSISGIVVPMEMIARGNLGLIAIAPLWPTFHAGQLALAVIRPALEGFVPLHIIALVAFTVGFLVLAVLGQRRNKLQSYG
jgi:ABC-2 type transport system permease protein